jgi:hypothetical protein
MEASEWIALGGVGVAAASVILSLLQEDLRRRFLPPQLAVRVATTVFKVLSKTEGQYIPRAYLRLQLTVTSNHRGAARGVQVTLLSVSPDPVLGEGQQVHDPHMLRPLRWSYEHKASVDLPSGGSRYVDVLEVSGETPHRATLTITEGPPEGLNLLKRSDEPYTIRVSITGENVRSAERTLTVWHRGGWNGDDSTAAEELGATVS